MKRFLALSLITIMAFSITGCSSLTDLGGQQSINIDDPNNANVNVPGYDKDNIDAQVQAAIDEKNQDNQNTIYRDLTDQELAELKQKILSFHDKSSSDSVVDAVKRYEELRDNMNLFAYNAINRSNSEELILDMQSSLAKSRFKIPDYDSDGLPDYIEMMVTGTSPLLNKTAGSKLDSQERYDVAYIMYVNQAGEIATIQPEFSQMFHKAISNGTIKPLNDQYIVLNMRLYGKDLKSVNIVIEDEDNDYVSQIMSKLNAGSVFPISFSIRNVDGSSSVSGGLDIEHMDYSGITDQEAIIIQNDEDLITSKTFIDYLARTETSTSLPPDTSLAIGKTYTLVFPNQKTFEQDFSEACAKIYYAQHPELVEDKK